MMSAEFFFITFSFSICEAAPCSLVYGQISAGGKRVGHRILERSDREESTAGRGEDSLIDPSERRLHRGRHKTSRHGLAAESEEEICGGQHIE